MDFHVFVDGFPWIFMGFHVFHGFSWISIDLSGFFSLSFSLSRQQRLWEFRLCVEMLRDCLDSFSTHGWESHLKFFATEVIFLGELVSKYYLGIFTPILGGFIIHFFQMGW